MWAREHGLRRGLRVRCVRDHGRGADGVMTVDRIVIANFEFEQFGRRRGVAGIIRRHRRLNPPITLVLALEAREVVRFLSLLAPELIAHRRIRVVAVPDIVPPSEARRAVARIISDFP